MYHLKRIYVYLICAKLTLMLHNVYIMEENNQKKEYYFCIRIWQIITLN